MTIGDLILPEPGRLGVVEVVCRDSAESRMPPSGHTLVAYRPCRYCKAEV